MPSTLTFGDCPTCRGSTAIVGLDCTCGNHFHVGEQLVRKGAQAISCPRCETASAAIDGTRLEPVMPTSEEGIIDIVCGEVEPAVAKRVRRVAASRRSTDPSYWANVMLRESWWVEHGSYDGWDEAARAGGQDPTMYGPA